MSSSPNDPAGAEGAVATSFLRRLIEDESAGGARAVEEYVRLYPGFDAVIVREYEAALGGTRPDSITAGGRIDEYELIEKLGEGGFGQVWLAHDHELGRRAALKILGRGVGTDRDVARLEREAAVASRVDHDGLCTVYAARLGGTIPYIAMQWVEGRPLSRLVSESRERGYDSPRIGAGGLDPLLRAVAGIARALHAAHEAGIVHRDVKPANLMVRPSGEPVVLDFGLARDLDVAPESLSWELRGTIGYMAPEQLGPSPEIDRRVDVHALGVVLFECLALERPWRGRTLEEIAANIRESPPPDLRRASRFATRELCAVVERCLEKDPARRYATALDLAEDVERVMAGEPVTARPPSTLRRLVARARRRPAASALIVVLAAVLFGSGALAAWLGRQSERIARGEQAERAEDLERRLEAGFLALGSYEAAGAQELFVEAAARHPGSVEAAAGEALALIDRARPAEAAARVRPLVAAHPELRCVLDGAEARVREGSPPSDPGGNDGTSPLGWFLIGQMWLLRAGDGSGVDAARKALRAMDRACLSSPGARAIYHFGRARAAGVARDTGAARTSAEALGSLWPDSSAAAFFAGFSLFGAGDLDGAITHLRRAVDLDDDFTLARIGLAGALIDAGRPREGLAQYAVVLERAPDDPTANFNSGLACEQLGELERAVAFYRRGLAADPGYAAMRANLVAALKKLGDDAGVGEEFGRWARRDADDAAAWMRWARHEAAHLDDDASVARLETAARRAWELSASPEAGLLLATALVESDREHEARPVAERALETATGPTATDLRDLLEDLP